MKSEPIKPKEAQPHVRIESFDEVVLGYVEDQVLKEASRCLACHKPVCSRGCPVGIDIKKFIQQLKEKDYRGAYFTIRERNDFPSICGRVCPAEYQCCKACVLNKKGSNFAYPEAINIHFLERFVGDFGMTQKLNLPAGEEKNLCGFKVAVVGSGPAGLCCAGELARKGVRVTVFESLHKLGGVLRYGIPSFRLPRNILDYEIEYLEKMGVEFVPNLIIGKTKKLEDLFAQGFQAVFLGLGAGVPAFLGIKGENSCNIYSANEFLTRINLMSAYKFPKYHTPVNVGKKIIVVGGGNTAIDCARAAVRLQKLNKIKSDTTVIYRRTEQEMPARRLEIEHAKEEGIKFNFLIKPQQFFADAKGFVRRLHCLRCELGEADESGRRKPIEIKGSDFDIECDLAIIAIGLKANEVLTRATAGLKTDASGDIVINPENMETSLKGVFAGGDIVGGEGTVIEAMGMAKKAAAGIINYIAQSK